MNVGKQAEAFISEYFEKKRNTKLVKHQRGDRGFDFRDNDSKLFVEVKGSVANKLSDVLFCYFTNAEYEKAKESRATKKSYEIHLVLGIGTNNRRHYKIPAKVFLEKARPEIVWSLPIRQEINEYEVRESN